MGFGDSLKKWASSKATEMLTADSGKRESAAASADAAEQQAKSDLGEQLLRTAFPKLGEWADKQEADKSAREQAAEQERRDEIASLPLATVQLSVTGHVTAQWSGQLPGRATTSTPNEPDPHRPVRRPAARLVRAVLRRTPRVPTSVVWPLTHWGFQIPGLPRRRHLRPHRDRPGARGRGRGAGLPEWAMDFANSDDSSFYFYIDAGPVDGHASPRAARSSRSSSR